MDQADELPRLHRGLEVTLVPRVALGVCLGAKEESGEFVRVDDDVIVHLDDGQVGSFVAHKVQQTQALQGQVPIGVAKV